MSHYTHDCASAKFSTNSHETDYSVATAAPVWAISAALIRRVIRYMSKLVWDGCVLSSVGDPAMQIRMFLGLPDPDLDPSPFLTKVLRSGQK
jgi:hypothetical protein